MQEQKSTMITKVNHYQEQVAKHIHDVFQRSYQIEATLIGTTNFPPLRRSVSKIQSSNTEFYAYMAAGVMAAVIEIEENKQAHCLDIHSLTVDPHFFRQGIASKLLAHVIKTTALTTVTVETAVVNAPAITLYEKHGFEIYQQWTPDHGIEKVAMSLTKQKIF